MSDLEVGHALGITVPDASHCLLNLAALYTVQ